ncbi:MAG: hypothetical protein PHN72_03365 [Bacilli bacterium]|nr:hypothetical protein [Bacilli bacterium]
MEFVLEIIGEFVFEILFYTGTDKKVSKWIRYPILFLLILLYGFIIFGLLGISIKLLNENIMVSILLFILDIFIIIFCIKWLQKGRDKSSLEKKGTHEKR